MSNLLLFLIPIFTRMRVVLGYSVVTGELEIIGKENPYILEKYENFIQVGGTASIFTWFNVALIYKVKLDRPMRKKFK